MLRPWHGIFIDFHRQVEEVFEEMVFRRWKSTRPPEWSPSVDFHETPDDFFVLIDLPGVSPENLRLSLVGRQLAITGEKRDPLPAERVHSRCERPSGHFHRIVELPFHVDPAQITAEERHGLYCIRIPKKAVRQTPLPRSGTEPEIIPVQSV